MKHNSVIFEGNCFAVKVHDRTRGDKHQSLSFLIKDDGNWIPNLNISSYWLQEIIDKLQEAQKFLETTCKKVENDGWFRK